MAGRSRRSYLPGSLWFVQRPAECQPDDDATDLHDPHDDRTGRAAMRSGRQPRRCHHQRHPAVQCLYPCRRHHPHRARPRLQLVYSLERLVRRRGRQRRAAVLWQARCRRACPADRPGDGLRHRIHPVSTGTALPGAGAALGAAGHRRCRLCPHDQLTETDNGPNSTCTRVTAWSSSSRAFRATHGPSQFPPTKPFADARIYGGSAGRPLR